MVCESQVPLNILYEGEVHEDAYLNGLLDALHPFSEVKLAAILHAYLDESYDGNSRAFAIAGWLASARDWKEFSAKWRARIAREGIRSAHMSDCESGYAAFVSWSRERRFGLIQDLISIITESNIAGFGTAILVGDYQRILCECSGMQRRLLGDGNPYHLSFQNCIQDICCSIADMPTSERVAFFFDRHPSFEFRAKESYDAVCSDMTLSYHSRLGAIVFDSKENLVSLQAADILAFEIMKMLLNPRFFPHLPERKSTLALKPKIKRAVYFDEPTLRQLLSIIDRELANPALPSKRESE